MKSNEIDVLLHGIREELAAEYKPRTNEELEADARRFAAAYGLDVTPTPSPNTKK